MYKSILVPTDGSPLSRKAVKQAMRFAKEQAAKVVGFYVAPAYRPNIFEDYSTQNFVSPQQYAAAAKKRAAKILEIVKQAAAESGVSCTCSHAFSDFPYTEIIKAAERNKSDLIFMASHGRRGISRLILGSETSKVLAHTKIPVLVTR
jgi:nucleotide-binding universal stress UspA family protein